MTVALTDDTAIQHAVEVLDEDTAHGRAICDHLRGMLARVQPNTLSTTHSSVEWRRVVEHSAAVAARNEALTEQLLALGAAILPDVQGDLAKHVAEVQRLRALAPLLAGDAQ